MGYVKGRVGCDVSFKDCLIKSSCCSPLSLFFTFVPSRGDGHRRNTSVVSQNTCGKDDKDFITVHILYSFGIIFIISFPAHMRQWEDAKADVSMLKINSNGFSDTQKHKEA